MAMPEPSYESKGPAGILLYQDAYVSCTVVGHQAALSFHSEQAAGAIGQAQGESIQKALTLLKEHSITALKLTLNSAGAHFKEPLEGLFYLNVLAESLWQLRQQGIKIQVHCPGWLYGGMALILASVAQEITLHPQARMGLLGPKLSGHMPGESNPTPALDFQPEHLELKRLRP
jgi:acetyl-CoA carboxylase beta subunit